MSWASVDELISDLNLKSDPDDTQSIRSEIKEKLVNNDYNLIITNNR